MHNTLSRKAMLGSLASIGLVAGVSTVAEAAPPPDALIGAWTLESFNERIADGEFKPRFGPNPIGYLIYTASGRVSAILQGVHRPPFRSPDGISTSPALGEESVHNFLAYAGRVEVFPDHVLHHVETSIFTDLVGVTLKRGYKLDGDTLTIHTLPPYIWGSQSVLVWKRT